jgi:hypothetical protein
MLYYALIEHLHQHSLYDPAVEILDEVHQLLNPVNRLEDCWDPENMHNFQIPGRRSPGIV